MTSSGVPISRRMNGEKKIPTRPRMIPPIALSATEVWTASCIFSFSFAP